MKTMLSIVYRWLKIGVFCSLLFSLLGYWGNQFMYFELASHFRLQYFVFSILAISLLIIRIYWKWSVLAVLCLVINGVEVIPWYYEDSEQSIMVNKNTVIPLRLLHVNAHTRNTQYNKLIKLIDSENPDLIFIQETNTQWVTALKEIDSDYPHQVLMPRSDNFGIALYSRMPFVKSELIEDFSPSQLPSIYVELELQKTLVSILSTHPLPPVGQEYFKDRNHQLNQVAKLLNDIPNEKILIGDLNVTMWSTYFKSLVQNTEMNNARKGFGTLPSWPTNLPFLKIPIDHCLVSEGLRVVEVKLGDDIASDHLPLIVDIAINNNE